MSKIKFGELSINNSELKVLDSTTTNTIMGGRRRGIRNSFINLQSANIIQVNNNVAIQISFGGDNINVANLTNNAGVSQSITNG